MRSVVISAATAILLLSPVARAVDLDSSMSHELMVAVGFYTLHYRSTQDQHSVTPLVALEWRRDDGWLAGGALFRNSFRQFSQTVYVGYLQDFGASGFYGKLSGGLLHGYTGKYEHRVPLNYRGFSPVLIPAVGYKIGAVRMELEFIWARGVLLTAGYAFR